MTEEDIQVQLSRRRPGQSDISTPVGCGYSFTAVLLQAVKLHIRHIADPGIIANEQRSEFDTVHLQSGTEHGVTLGTPIGLMVHNKDQRPHDYAETDLYPRPSHADYTYLAKYGVKASSGGGRASARETIGRVAAGAIAEKYMKEAYGVEIVAFVSGVGKVALPFTDEDNEVLGKDYLDLVNTVTREQVDKEITRCPHTETSKKMEEAIRAAKGANDSLGGVLTCVIRNAPLGLGEPAFDKLEALLAHAMLSIPSTKGFEVGSGFRGATFPGSVHNDPFVEGSAEDGGRLRTTTNWSGGIQGGITNGEDIYFRCVLSAYFIADSDKSIPICPKRGSREDAGVRA